jgi:large subunit ribosomal protein L25
MSETLVVEVESREQTGKNANRRLRRQHRIPAVVYGLDQPAFLVSVNPRKLSEILHLESGRNTIFSLSLVGEDQTRAAMIKDLQRDPVSDDPIHVDFIRLDLSKKIIVRIPVRLVEVAVGVKNDGGVMDFIQRDVEVECLPGDIPEHLDVDVSGLHINQHVSVSDLVVVAGVEVLNDADSVVAVVVPPKAEEEVVEEVAEEPVEEGAEPEVIKKGKETDEGADAGKDG